MTLKDSIEHTEKQLTYEQAVEFARERHKGQLDKSGLPVFNHVFRVSTAVQGPIQRIVGVLHDILEDTPTSLKELKDLGATDDVLQAVCLLTRCPDVKYMDYIHRLCWDPIARAVKREDLLDNLSETRMCVLDEATQKRLRAKYSAALEWVND